MSQWRWSNKIIAYKKRIRWRLMLLTYAFRPDGFYFWVVHLQSATLDQVSNMGQAARKSGLKRGNVGRGTGTIYLSVLSKEIRPHTMAVNWQWKIAVYKRNRRWTEPCSTLLVMKLSGQIGLVCHDECSEICWKGTILAKWAQYWQDQKHTLVYLAEFDGWQSKNWRNPAELGSCCQSWGECQSISHWRMSRAICHLSLAEEDCVPFGK